MPRDYLEGCADEYDVVVIGSGLGGLTAANILGRAGYRVLVVEQHYKLGGLATWFKRPGGRIFDVSLHGFPHGMVKSCRRYWSDEIASWIVPLRHIRFENPTFSLTTTYQRDDFARLLVERFGLEPRTVEEFFSTVRRMSLQDDQGLTNQQLFERFFPGRDDVVRLLIEPIAYANGSTLEDPAVTYGIVFSNFMSRGVFTFRGGTDQLIAAMQTELARSGVAARVRCDVRRIEIRRGRIQSVRVNDREIRARAVISNANLRSTILELAGREHFDAAFIERTESVRLNNSSTQVYLALRPGEELDPATGDLLFCSTAPAFRTDWLLGREPTSRTFSFYYADVRPNREHRHCIVSSTNARYEDWANLTDAEYAEQKGRLIEGTLDALEKFVPQIRQRVDHVEAATPRTFEHYTRHVQGANFGTKFEGLSVSRSLPEQVAGLYHAGSCGIIMSGWLGTINYGVIVAHDVDRFLSSHQF